MLLILIIVVLRRRRGSRRTTQNEQDLLLGADAARSRDHWFGTDELGRDQLTEILYAGQISLKIGLAVAFLSTVVGAIVGAVAGYFGRATDQVLMRLTDLFLVVPAAHRRSALSSRVEAVPVGLRRQVGVTIDIKSDHLVLAFLGWMYIARVVRGQVLSLKEKEFVEAARAARRVEHADHRPAHHPELDRRRSW